MVDPKGKLQGSRDTNILSEKNNPKGKVQGSRDTKVLSEQKHITQQ
jgi:hypothetical protein